MPTRREFIERLAAAGSLAGISVGLGGCERASERLAALIVPDDEIAPRPPDGEGIDEVTHVLNRLTWGPRPGDRARLEARGGGIEAVGAVRAFVNEQLNPESIDDRRCEWRIDEIESLTVPRAELYEIPPQRLIADLARAKLLRAIAGRRQLHELMVDFWTDHLNIAPAKGDCRWMKVADDREVVRPHAMGRFRDLIRASATSPAMLVYLDGAENRVSHPDDRPNENYARELLELHTLGVHGGYTQRDVMEAARCLSGWTFTHDWRRFFTARVAFDRSRHDEGPKEVLGRTVPPRGGADDLEILLDIVCAHPSTAQHIASKLCRFFVADPPPRELVVDIAAAFTNSDGRIRPTLRALFDSPAFLAARGTLLKRPMRFVVSALRALDARTDAGAAIAAHLRRMGHAPFGYPSPDGYPLEAQPWLGTLLWRWNFALDLAHARISGTRVDGAGLLARFGDAGAIARHLLGRRPNELEWEAFAAGDADALALALASPAFQWH
ncbi:MAG: DUF1800 domain-containing protein [Phycisphaerales bacterium]